MRNNRFRDAISMKQTHDRGEKAQYSVDGGEWKLNIRSGLPHGPIFAPLYGCHGYTCY